MPDVPDAGRPDAGRPDASAPDAGLAERRLYVLDLIVIPRTVDQVNMVALDLDGNGTPENVIGALLVSLANILDRSFSPAANAAIDGGLTLELIDADLPAVRVGPGEDLDADPEDNFSGAEPLAFSTEPEPMPGLAAGGELEAGPGAITLRLALFGGVPPVDLPGVAARLRAEVRAGGELGAGRLVIGLVEESVDTVFVPYLHAGFVAIVAADCPGGVCEPDSAGERLLESFDDNENAELEYREVRRDALITNTVDNPDLDLFDADGVFNPGVDGVKETLSFGVGFTAVSAALAP